MLRFRARLIDGAATDKLSFAVEIFPDQNEHQKELGRVPLHLLARASGKELQRAFDLAKVDGKQPLFALVSVWNTHDNSKVASGTFDLGPLAAAPEGQAARLADAEVVLRAPKGAKVFTLSMSASYAPPAMLKHQDREETLSDHSSEAAEDDEAPGRDPYATDDSSEAEDDDIAPPTQISRDEPELLTDDSSEADEDDVRPGGDPYATDDSSEADEDDIPLEKSPDTLPSPPAGSPDSAPKTSGFQEGQASEIENDSEQDEDDVVDDDSDAHSASYGSDSFVQENNVLEVPLVPTVDTRKQSVPIIPIEELAKKTSRRKKQSNHAPQAWEALYCTQRFEGESQAKDKAKMSRTPKAKPKAKPSKTSTASPPAKPVRPTTGDRKQKRPSRRSSEEDSQAFLRRMDQRAEHKRLAAQDLQARLDYEATLRKKVCPECGRTQSFEQVKKRQKKCIECKVLFRYSVRWNQVRDDFMDRNTNNSSCEPGPPAPPRSKRPSKANEEFLARMDQAAERRRRRNLAKPKSKPSAKPEPEPAQRAKTHVPSARTLRGPVSITQIFDPDMWRAEQLVIAHLFGPCEPCQVDLRCE